MPTTTAADGGTLPAPVQQAVAFTSPSPTLSTRLSSFWATIKRRLLTSAPSDSFGHPPTTEGTSDSGGSAVRGAWVERRRRMESDFTAEPGGLVEEVIVDRSEWGEKKDEGGTRAYTAVGEDGTGEEGVSDRSSLYEERRKDGGGMAGWWWTSAWPALVEFFDPRYRHDETEQAFLKEQWYSSKVTYIIGSCFLCFNTIMVLSLTPKPWSPWLYVSNCALQPCLTFPMPFFVAWDVPKKHRVFWQCWLWVAIWLAGSSSIIDMRICDYYHPALSHCGNRDFVGTFYYSTALPLVALITLGQKRHFALFGILFWTGLVVGAIVTVRPRFIRTAANWIVFELYVLWFNFTREREARRVYTLRANLKIQFRATQRAQIRERKIVNSKERLTSYLFHEMRVPLNTALLAYQNLEANKAFSQALDSEHGVEYAALDGSLQTMRAVLNDILDFSRMEKGGFSSVNKPFSFHRVLRSIVEPLQLDAHARGLALVTTFDPRIDTLAVKAANAGKDFDEDSVVEGMGMVVGDELRLRQVINNLASNACKFTAPGGCVTIRTSLVFPVPPAPTLVSRETGATSITEHRLHEHEKSSTPAAAQNKLLVVRVEVEDTGVGIDTTDARAIFNAYVQTEAGLNQGGKGTGLGLSLCRQIVALSRGRLGVKSKVGEGTTMWMEIPYTIGPQVTSVDGVDFAREEKMEKELGTPQTYSDDPERTDYGFAVDNDTGESALHIELSTPPLSRILETEDVDLTPTQTPLPSHTAPLPLPRLGTPMPPTVTPLGVIRNSDPAVMTLPEANVPLASSSLAPSDSRMMHFDRGPLRVLVCDDDALTRKLMSRMLERLGCVVSVAENGALALELLLENDTSEAPAYHFEITFLDNQMPIMSGIQAVSQLRSSGRHDLVVGVTANALLQDQEQFIQAGATAVLTKPVREADLRRFLTLADERRSKMPPTPTLPP